MLEDNDHFPKIIRKSTTNLNTKRSVKRIRLKRIQCKQLVIYWCVVCVLSVFSCVQANRPPRFLIDGQTEIVLRLKEGEETPVGKFKFQNIILVIFFIYTYLCIYSCIHITYLLYVKHSYLSLLGSVSWVLLYTTTVMYF